MATPEFHFEMGADIAVAVHATGSQCIGALHRQYGTFQHHTPLRGCGHVREIDLRDSVADRFFAHLDLANDAHRHIKTMAKKIVDKVQGCGIVTKARPFDLLRNRHAADLLDRLGADGQYFAFEFFDFSALCHSAHDNVFEIAGE